jgi:hypothetical protein
MDDHEIPPELTETDAALRAVVGRASEPAPVEHLIRIRTALAAEAAHRDEVSRRDWWVLAGLLGMVSVGVVGPTAPLLMGATFAVGLVWSRLLAQALDHSGRSEVSSV